jgi:hypothetical protein
MTRHLENLSAISVAGRVIQLPDEEEHTEPIQPGREQPNGQEDKGNLEEPEHFGNLDNGPQDK